MDEKQLTKGIEGDGPLTGGEETLFGGGTVVPEEAFGEEEHNPGLFLDEYWDGQEMFDWRDMPSGILSKTDEIEFNVGRKEDPPAYSVACAKCGSTQFHIAMSYKYVAIKCPECEWEGQIGE